MPEVTSWLPPRRRDSHGQRPTRPTTAAAGRVHVTCLTVGAPGASVPSSGAAAVLGTGRLAQSSSELAPTLHFTLQVRATPGPPLDGGEGLVTCDYLRASSRLSDGSYYES